MTNKISDIVTHVFGVEIPREEALAIASPESRDAYYNDVYKKMHELSSWSMSEWDEKKIEALQTENAVLATDVVLWYVFYNTLPLFPNLYFKVEPYIRLATTKPLAYFNLIYYSTFPPREECFAIMSRPPVDDELMLRFLKYTALSTYLTDKRSPHVKYAEKGAE